MTQQTEQPEIKTYILKSGGKFKIGKSKDVNKRLKAYYTHNPDVELICVIRGDFEKKLHKRFKSLKIRNEWYNLDGVDLYRLYNTIGALEQFSKEAEVIPHNTLKGVTGIDIDDSRGYIYIDENKTILWKTDNYLVNPVGIEFKENRNMCQTEYIVSEL